MQRYCKMADKILQWYRKIPYSLFAKLCFSYWLILTEVNGESLQKLSKTQNMLFFPLNYTIYQPSFPSEYSKFLSKIINLMLIYLIQEDFRYWFRSAEGRVAKNNNYSTIKLFNISSYVQLICLCRRKSIFKTDYPLKVRSHQAR